MEKTYNPALIQRTQRYMETHSISQNQFAAKVNLSSAALSSYLNQKYKGSVEAVERQLREFFKLDEEAEAAAEKTASLLPRAAYVPTSISEDVCQSIRFAQLEHCMVVLHGDAGVGKSKGAQKFLRDHPTNAVGISITPSTGTLNGSIKLLARALRVPECRNKMDQMMALRSRLDGTNWVIVIDEAQHLKYAALEEIRSLTDDNPMTGEHGVGVVLIGNSEVYSRLQGRQQAQFAQLFSRIRMQREYTTRKVKEDDVRKLFPVLAEQDARKEMDFLLSVCRSPWGIRGAMNLYTNAASANDVGYENLYRMAAHMGIGMLDWLKPILGDGYNEEIDNKIAAEINKGFVAKADYDAAKDAQRTAAEALADANKALAEYKDTDIDGLRKSAEEWQAKAEQAEKDADARVAAVQFDAKLDSAIAAAHGRSGKAIRALLDLDALRGSEDPDKDIPAALSALQKDSGYMFDTEETPPPYAAGTGRTAMTTDNSDSALRKAMGLPME